LKKEYNKDLQLSDDVIKQIKDFNHSKLATEQKSLISELVSNEEVRERYEKYGLCWECNQPNTGITQGIS